jgi:hypothetical protein
MNKKYIILAGDRNLDNVEQYLNTYGKINPWGYPDRWDNYLGVPKHLIPIKGEPLIHRTQRLLLENGEKNIWVSCNKQNFESYVIPGCNPVETNFDKNSLYPDHEFSSTDGMENENGITVLLFGDIYYSEKIIKHLVDNKSEDWHYYARWKNSDTTGKIYGEMFAWYYNHSHIKKLKESAILSSELTKEYVRKHQIGELKYPWIMEESSKMTYRIMAGLDTEDPHGIENSKWVEWDDETEDFDYPIDWDKWSKNLPYLAY